MTIQIEEAAMTPTALGKQCDALAELLGQNASVRVAVARYARADYVVNVALEATGIPYKVFFASTWAEAFAQASAFAASQRVVSRNTLIRKMALAIIELTDEHGECSAIRLKGKDFSAADIAAHHQAACVRAGEMAMGAPFAVLHLGELGSPQPSAEVLHLGELGEAVDAQAR